MARRVIQLRHLRAESSAKMVSATTLLHLGFSNLFVMKPIIIFRLCLVFTLAIESSASVCRPKYPNYPLLPSSFISTQPTTPYGISQTLAIAPVSEPTLFKPIESTKPAPGGILLSESASLPEGNLPSDVSFITSVSLTAYPSLTGASTEGNPSLPQETASTSGLLSEGILTSHETSDGLVTPSELVEAPSDGKAGISSTIVSTDADRVSQESQAQTEDHLPSGGSTQTRTSSLIQDASTLLDTDSSADISLVTSEIPGSSVKTEFQGFPTGAPASDVLKHPSGDIPLPSTPTSAVTLSDELSTASEVSEASFSLPGKPPADTTNSLSGPEITIPAESSNVLASDTPSGSTPSAVASPDPTEDVSASGTLAGPSSMVSDASVATSTDISPDMASPVVPTADTSIPAEGSDDSQTGIITHSDSVEPSRLHANEKSPTGAASHLRSQSTDTLPPLDTTILFHPTELPGTRSPSDSIDTASPLEPTSSIENAVTESSSGENDSKASETNTVIILPTKDTTNESQESTTGDSEATTVATSDVNAPIISADTTTIPSITLIPTDLPASQTSALSKPSNTAVPATETDVHPPSPTKDEANDKGDEDNNNDDQDDDDDDDDDDDGPPIIPIPIPIDPKKPGGGKGGNKPSDSKPTDPKSTQEPAKSSENAESTSSCTTSISVTWESALCTVTAAVTTGTPACTTQAFTTVVSCSGTTASTTTSTTTVQVAESTWACSPSRCGGRKCTVAKRGLLDRTTYPPKCKWAGK
ncbi:Altered inheritance of mitochondria protein 6 [Fusarium oxysporum f. sp. albedinis]|nr:Altered inheritance of mitochondria protein 6 [Fusarium oxysporum f. sp. albedinis]